MSRLSSAGPSHENAIALPSGAKAGMVSAPGSVAICRTTRGPVDEVVPVGAAGECNRQNTAAPIKATAPTTRAIASTFGREGGSSIQLGGVWLPDDPGVGRAGPASAAGGVYDD